MKRPLTKNEQTLPSYDPHVEFFFTHMWQKNHNMESGGVIIMILSNSWKGSRCTFTNEAIKKARDPREINGRTITGNSSNSFYSFNIHIKNKWSWRMSGTEKWSWALNFTATWAHLHTIDIKNVLWETRVLSLQWSRHVRIKIYI